MNKTTVQRLAFKFSELLRKELSQSEFSDMLERNKKYRADGDTSVCASGDFCDSNVVMDEAFTALGLKSDDTDLWNAAWTLAKNSDFYWGMSVSATEVPHADDPKKKVWEWKAIEHTGNYYGGYSDTEEHALSDAAIVVRAQYRARE